MDEYIKKADVLEYLSARRNQVLKSPLSTLDAKFEVMEIFDFVDHRVESAEVAPVRHAKVIDKISDDHETIKQPWDYRYYCSACKIPMRDSWNKYCPNCGAKMDGGEPDA